MNRQRFEALLAAYGGRESGWPEEEREAALALLASDSRAREQLLQAEALDRQLDAYEPASVDLAPRIMAAIPEARLARFLGWLFPGGSGSLLRPAMAGAMPLVLGFTIGFLGVLQLPGQEVADWESQERALLAPMSEESWND
jgi:hypothetical protein